MPYEKPKDQGQEKQEEKMTAAKKMIGLLGVSPTRPMKDADGDGVPNIMDCKPNNPNKQGWIHDKVQQMKERSAQRREIRQAEREQYVKSKKEHAVRVGKERAKIEADRRIKGYKDQKGFGQAFMSGFAPPKKTTKTAPTYKYVKKGKHYKRVKVGGQQKQTARPPRDIDFSFINKKVF